MDDVFFVAGATGLTGRAVVARARSLGVRTVAHVRPDSCQLASWRTKFEALGAEVDATPWDEARMTETLTACAPTAVLALLGTTKKRGRQAAKAGGDPDAESYAAVDYGLTALLRRAAEACGHRPRFIYLSAIGVNDSTTNAYMAARARIERELREGTLPYAIARPSFIIGDRDEARRGEMIGAALVDGALGALGALGARRMRDRYRSMSGEELGRAMVALARDPRPEGRVVEADGLRGLAEIG